MGGYAADRDLQAPNLTHETFTHKKGGHLAMTAFCVAADRISPAV
jgi:hypothetical protein